MLAMMKSEGVVTLANFWEQKRSTVNTVEMYKSLLTQKSFSNQVAFFVGVNAPFSHDQSV